MHLLGRRHQPIKLLTRLIPVFIQAMLRGEGVPCAFVLEHHHQIEILAVPVGLTAADAVVGVAHVADLLRERFELTIVMGHHHAIAEQLEDIGMVETGRLDIEAGGAQEVFP